MTFSSGMIVLIDAPCKSVNNRLQVLRRLRYFLPTKAGVAFFVAYIVLSMLDYCNTIWGNTTRSNCQRLRLLQSWAASLHGF